jgi:hypothetical protein
MSEEISLEEKIEVMQHYADGGTVQYKRKKPSPSDQASWNNLGDCPEWDWRHYTYKKVAPKKKRMISIAELPLDTVHKDEWGFGAVAVDVKNNVIGIMTANGGTYSCDFILENFEGKLFRSSTGEVIQLEVEA